MHLSKSVLVALLAASLLPVSLPLRAEDDGGRSGHVKQVLLISVDGLHALDLSNYVATHSSSTLAYLSRRGVTYTNAATSQPSDSFPGLASLVTGGSPTTAGFWYDDTYNLSLIHILDGHPLAVVGTTYMSSEVQRLYFEYPNVYVWNRDLGQIHSAGLNMIRSCLLYTSRCV